MDYIFYKIYLYYKKKKDLPIISGICFLFVLELSIFFFLGMVFNFSTNQLFSKDHLSDEAFYSIFYGIFFIVAVINGARYGSKRRRERIIEKYNNKKDLFKTWQIFLLPVIFVALAILVISIFSRSLLRG